MNAVLVIDMQIGVVEPAHQAKEVLDRIADLVARARRARVPVVYVRHHHATWAALQPGAATWEIHPQLAPAAGDVVIGKTASDGFHDTALHDQLARLGVTHLIVTGMQTEYCVDTTCRRALTLGYDVTLVADGHTTWDGPVPAEQIISYHNAILPGVAHPAHRVTVRPAAEIAF